MYVVTQVLNGLGVGAIYALVALGYSMVYGIVKLINFAHGDIIMVGSYIIFSLLNWFMPVWAALLVSMVLCALLGMLTERIAYQRLLDSGAPRIALLITAIGVSLLLQNTFQLIFGSGAQPMPKMFEMPPVQIDGINISNTLLNIAVSLVMMFVLQMLVSRTKIGKAMQATSEDPGAAVLMGINTQRVILFTFAVGSALAAVGGVLFSNTYMQITPFIGSLLGLKAFVAAVFGGIGSIPGAMLGGFVLGMAEGINNAFGNSSLTDAVVFALLIIILLIRPSGLLGQHVKEKV